MPVFYDCGIILMILRGKTKIKYQKMLTITNVPENTASKEAYSLELIKNILIGLCKMEQALVFSKEDTALYTHTLVSVFEQHSEERIRLKAHQFLIRQLRLEKILQDIVTRHQFLNTHCKHILPRNTSIWKKIAKDFFQLEEEYRIFNEIHFSVKRSYIRFTHEHFQLERRPFMVA